MIYRCNECSNDVEVPVEASGLQLSFCSFCGSSKFSIPKAEPKQIVGLSIPEGKPFYAMPDGKLTFQREPVYGGAMMTQSGQGFTAFPYLKQGSICSGYISTMQICSGSITGGHW